MCSGGRAPEEKVVDGLDEESAADEDEFYRVPVEIDNAGLGEGGGGEGEGRRRRQG